MSNGTHSLQADKAETGPSIFVLKKKTVKAAVSSCDNIDRINTTNKTCVNQSCASSGDSELSRVSSGWITSPSLRKFGGS